ncbi:MAG: hypothetical protein MZV65_53370 [Chromatiales bacterium]|nr:hypothetical protein [Chromatiales bacterium]
MALRNVNQQLRCESNLSMRDFAVAVDKLRSMDAARYQKTEASIVASLAACIIKIGKTQPERAMGAKSYAQRIFPNNSVISSIVIKGREACDEFAGRSGRAR